jgi:putative sigma-54 modulation protein
MMQTTISGNHIQVTEALRNYVTEKLARLARHSDQITNVHVVLSVDKRIRQRAEATLHVHGADLFADCESEDMYAAIDLLADKLDRQVLRHKERQLDRQHGH